MNVIYNDVSPLSSHITSVCVLLLARFTYACASCPNYVNFIIKLYHSTFCSQLHTNIVFHSSTNINHFIQINIWSCICICAYMNVIRLWHMCSWCNIYICVRWDIFNSFAIRMCIFLCAFPHMCHTRSNLFTIYRRHDVHSTCTTHYNRRHRAILCTTIFIYAFKKQPFFIVVIACGRRFNWIVCLFSNLIKHIVAK